MNPYHKPTCYKRQTSLFQNIHIGPQAHWDEKSPLLYNILECIVVKKKKKEFRISSKLGEQIGVITHLFLPRFGEIRWDQIFRTKFSDRKRRQLVEYLYPLPSPCIGWGNISVLLPYPSKNLIHLLTRILQFSVETRFKDSTSSYLKRRLIIWI